MALHSIAGGRAPDEFGRLHKLFVAHFAIAVGFVWLASLYAALHAPWLRNLRGLIDPFARPESTASFLFGLPALMTVAWLCVAFGGEAIRRSCLLKNQAVEFGLAGLVAFAVFCMAIDRAVTAYWLGA